MYEGGVHSLGTCRRRISGLVPLAVSYPELERFIHKAVMIIAINEHMDALRCYDAQVALRTDLTTV